MLLRTPRRRISPRTRRRYRAIRNFFRRTLGSIASQPDIKINSSIAVNVTDLNHKILGIEHELNEVSKHCHDLASFENISRKEIESLIPTEGNGRSNYLSIEKNLCSDRKLLEKDTKVLYKTPVGHFRKADNSSSVIKLNDEPSDKNRRSSDTMNYEMNTPSHQIRKAKSKNNRHDNHCENYGRNNLELRKHKTQAEIEDSTWSAGSYHSLALSRTNRPPPLGHLVQRHSHRQAMLEEYARSPVREEVKIKRHKDKSKRNKSVSPNRGQENRPGKDKKNKPVSVEMDQKFIADIIKRQYQPVNFYDKKNSDLSQMSFPVCRDQMHAIHEDIMNGSSCYVTGRGRPPARLRPAQGTDLSDMRSLCDTRLYSAHHHARCRPRKQHDVYNDCDLYDVIPVKEKSSPKSRRKFVEDNIHYEHLREIPPSPRTHRPRLNLKAQDYSDCESSPIAYVKHSHRRRSPNLQRISLGIDTFRSEISSEESTLKGNTDIQLNLVKLTKDAQIQEDMGTTSSLQHPTFTNDHTNTTLNDTSNISDSNDDKADKALCEIKDILQSFLQEIKKDSSASQCDKLNETSNDKMDGTRIEELQQDGTKVAPNLLDGNGHSGFNSYGLGQCSIPAISPPYLPGLAGMPGLPGLPSPCCYPVLPVCPMNCLQNCHGYTNNNEFDNRHDGCSLKENTNCETNTSRNNNSETDNLIREIYKYVAQNPNARKKESSESSNMHSPRDVGKTDVKTLTSRSVGRSSFTSQHDAKVGTLPLRCYSKSCEAIGSRARSDAHYSPTTASYSDTLLEKLSLDATTQSTSTYETSTDPSSSDQGKKGKFASVLQSFGLLKKNKKNKKDVIEELSESESTTEADVGPKHRHPFRQEVANYVMHGQEFLQPPPSPPSPKSRHPRRPSPHYDCGYCSYDSKINGLSSPVNDMYDPCHECRRSPPPHCGRQHPQASAPPYPNPYEYQCSHNMQPQVPLCLKEIEVKSTGTQSDRKMPFFRKLSQRKQPPVQLSRVNNQINSGTQTVQIKNKPGLFNWKELQAKAAAKKLPDIEPFAFSMKAQRDLANGDNKLKNAMIKKLFHKKNPFSSGNLLVRTLLGKDKSSWGVPPSNMVFRPKMFL